MTNQTHKQLRRATIVFWVLFLYIIAALAWWLVSLEQQNQTIHQLKREQVTASAAGVPERTTQLQKINSLQRRNTIKYITEGIFFFLLIFFGAAYIYRLVRRQFAMQQQQQNFAMAVTHELKTPISVARLNLETLQKHQLDAEKQKMLLQMTLQETMRLDTLINNILISSQLDAAAYKTAKENVDLSGLVAEALAQFASRYPHKKLYSHIDPGIVFKSDPLLMKLLVSNLLENANKYSGKTSVIGCTLKNPKSKVTLTVTDEGKGIPDEEKKKVFQKFYRIGNEETRKTQGTGLGLYICKKIAESHSAKITITDNEPQGSNFIVTFEVDK